MNELAVNLDGRYIVECLLKHIPNMIELHTSSDTDRRLLVFKMTDCNVVYLIESYIFKDILVYQVDRSTERRQTQEELDDILDRAFMLLMGALWSDV